ncbi:MAG: hypothetical protein ILP11_04265 [Alphaproteobacteria bacterium]|nr:hypothetical protein [Alphaproteobacteria bacterium]
MAKDMDLFLNFLRQDDPNAYLHHYQFTVEQKNQLVKHDILPDSENKMTSLAFLVLENEKENGKYTADILDLLKRKELFFEQPIYKTPDQNVYALKFMLAVNTSKDVWNAFIARKDVNVNVDGQEIFRPYCDILQTYDILNHPRMNVNAKSDYVLYDPDNRSYVADLQDCPLWMIAGARKTLATCDEFKGCSLAKFEELLVEEKKFSLFMAQKPADSTLIGCRVKSGMFEQTCFGFADLSQTLTKVYTHKFGSAKLEPATLIRRVSAEVAACVRTERENAITGRQYE